MRRHHRVEMAPDVHAFVLARLDAQLSELHRLRHELVQPRPSLPGARWQAAAATAIAARRFASDVAAALNSVARVDQLVYEE